MDFPTIECHREGTSLVFECPHCWVYGSSWGYDDIAISGHYKHRPKLAKPVNHTHGGGDSPGDGDGYRIAHCWGGTYKNSGGYILKEMTMDRIGINLITTKELLEWQYHVELVRIDDRVLYDCIGFGSKDGKDLDKVNWGGWLLDSNYYTLELWEEQRWQIYEVDLERCLSSGQVLDWIIQISNKNWAGPYVVSGLIHAIDILINPQGTLCSFGLQKELTSTKSKKLVDRWISECIKHEEMRISHE